MTKHPKFPLKQSEAFCEANPGQRAIALNGRKYQRTSPLILFKTKDVTTSQWHGDDVEEIRRPHPDSGGKLERKSYMNTLQSCFL
jgi:hypothetical protein